MKNRRWNEGDDYFIMPKTNGKPSSKPNNKNNRSGPRRRRLIFIETQDLCKNIPKELERIVIVNNMVSIGEEEAHPKPVVVKSLCDKIWGTPGCV